MTNTTAVAENPPPLQKLLHSVEDVQAMTGLGKTTVFAEIAAGRLAAVKFGRRTMVPDAALKDWIGRLPAVTPSHASYAHRVKARQPMAA